MPVTLSTGHSIRWPASVIRSSRGSTSIAVNASDEAYISYQFGYIAGQPSSYDLKLATGMDSSWTLTTVDTGEGFRYGLGVFVWNSDFGSSYGHSGFVPGYNSIMEYVPRYRLAVALQFNCDNVSQLLKKNRHDNAVEFIRIVIKYLK